MAVGSGLGRRVLSAEVVTVQRTIKAHPATVFSVFTGCDRWLSWQGVTGRDRPTARRDFRMNERGDGYASDRFLTVEPDRRIVFTWGWEGRRLAGAARLQHCRDHLGTRRR